MVGISYLYITHISMYNTGGQVKTPRVVRVSCCRMRSGIYRTE